MALSAADVWEVRTTGSDAANSGGFKSGATGTDYSQQDAVQFSGTDLVVDATTNTKVTSATHNFVAADVGNLVQITAGAGWTTGFYEIVSVASNAATLDRSPAAVGTTGGTWAEGGALATPGKAAGAAVAGNTIFCKNGTYTIANGTANTAGNKISMTVGGDTTALTPFRWVGYNTTRTVSNSDATRPIWQAAANSTTIFDSGTQTNVWVTNIDFDGNSGTYTSTRGMNIGASSSGFLATRCKFRNCANNGVNSVLYTGNWQDCEFTTNSSTAFSGRGNLTRCNLHDNTATAVSFGFDGSLTRCLITNNTGASSDGVVYGANNIQVRISHCTIHGNGRDGFRSTSFNASTVTVLIENSIFTSNSGYGVNLNGATSAFVLLNVASKSNTSGRSNNLNSDADIGAVALTADPYTNSAGGDFSLNNTAGGGAACRAAGIPGVFPGGTATGYLDVGVLQHQDALLPWGGFAGRSIGTY